MDIAHIPPRVAAVIREVALDHEVSVEGLLGPRHLKKLAAARRDAMWRVRALRWPRMFMGRSHPSYPQIGRWFGRHHSTVILAVQKVSRETFLSPDDIAPVDERLFAVDREPKRQSIAA